MLRRGLVLVGAIGLGLLRFSDAVACSCVGAQTAIIGPDRVNDAPLNTRVRFVVPRGYPGSGKTTPTPSALVRVSGTNARTDMTQRDWVDGVQTFIELTPTKPLAPETRYEVAFIDADPNAYPSTTVLSTFKTATAADTTAPKLDAVGTPIAKGNAHAGGGDCSIRGPWIEIPNVSATDPGRPNAKLMFGIWGSDAAGNLDTSKPPTVLVTKYGDQVTVGKRSLCDPHDFPISPTVPTMSIAIAAVDEAGNQSAVRRLPKITLSGVGNHP